MSEIMDTSADHEPASLAISFEAPDSGWLPFKVVYSESTWPVCATELHDPFPEMMCWLEKIVDREEVATWAIEEEGSVVQFIFLPKVRTFPFGAVEQLVYLRTAMMGDVIQIESRHLDARTIVAGFYKSFRNFVESERYLPIEWERSDESIDEDSEDWSSWHGHRLTELRSAKIEAILLQD